MIKKIQLNFNNTDHSKSIAKDLQEKLIKNDFEIVRENPDLVIAVGGDGTFLSTLKANKFNTKPLYVGVHTGHLGFLQEIDIERIDEFIDIVKKEDYKIENVKLEEISINDDDNKKTTFFALNEVTIRQAQNKVLFADIFINDAHFETFAGDGIIVSTPVGSTAHNASVGGAIIYPTLNVIQMSGISPIHNSSYRSLRNSVVIPDGADVLIKTEKDLSIFIDGEHILYNKISEISIKISEQSIKILKFNNYNYWTRVKEKLI